MTVNFLGSVVPLPILKYMDRYLELMEQYAAGSEYDQVEFSQVTMIVGTYSFIQLAIVGIGLFFLMRRRRRIFVSDRCEILIPKQRRASVIVGNAGAIAYLVLTAAMMVISIITV